MQSTLGAAQEEGAKPMEADKPHKEEGPAGSPTKKNRVEEPVLTLSMLRSVLAEERERGSKLGRGEGGRRGNAEQSPGS